MKIINSLYIPIYIIIILFIFLISSRRITKTGQTSQIFKKKNDSIRYLLYIPENYNEYSSKKWPLIIYYHGSGESGKNINLVKKHGIPKLVEYKKNFPFIVISPQYEIDKNFNLINEVSKETYLKFINHIISKYNIDRKKVYLTGLSLGGHITWQKAIDYPDIFTAIAPVCGYFSNENFNNPRPPKNIHLLKDMPVWIFHGELDNNVSFIHSKIMADSLIKINNKVKFTIFPDKGHNIQYDVYEKNEDLYNWFLMQKK